MLTKSLNEEVFSTLKLEEKTRRERDVRADPIGRSLQGNSFLENRRKRCEKVETL